MPSFKLLSSDNKSPNLAPQRIDVPPAGDNAVEDTFKGAVAASKINNADRNIHVWIHAAAVGATAVIRLHYYDENDKFLMPSDEVTLTTLNCQASPEATTPPTPTLNRSSTYASFPNPGAYSYRIFVVSASANVNVYGGRQP